MNLRDLLLQEIEQEQPQTINDAPIISGGVVENVNPQRNWRTDFASGYNDNYQNSWGNTNLPKEKNWATRIGEGLGTIGRFIDSPLGRGLLAGGLNKALGYDDSFKEGLTAYVGRKNAQTADRVYRKQLEQMGYSDKDLSNITGDITPSIYKGLTDSFRLGNQRMTYGQLAMFDNTIAEMLRENPELANQFVPLTFARDIYTKRGEKAQADIDKTKAETEQVGKPKVIKTIKEGHVVVDNNYNSAGGGKGGKGGKGGNSPVKPPKKPHNKNAF